MYPLQLDLQLSILVEKQYTEVYKSKQELSEKREFQNYTTLTPFYERNIKAALLLGYAAKIKAAKLLMEEDVVQKIGVAFLLCFIWRWLSVSVSIWPRSNKYLILLHFNKWCTKFIKLAKTN
jgi:hypothetical protein